MSGATINGNLPPWVPDELGMPRASAASVALVALIGGGLIYASLHLRPEKPKVQVTTIHMVELPKPPPPKPLPVPPPPVPPPPIPIPKPVPKPIIHHPVPVKTKIPVPVKHVVIHHPVPVKRIPPPPVKHVVVQHRPPPPPVPQPPPQPAFNFQAYASSLRGPIQSLVHVSQAMRMLHLQGTAYILFELTPDGRLVFAKVYRSSGNPLIDKAALSAVERMNFVRYRFPGTAPKQFALPIEILPYGSQ
ncbi:MAG TPA: energy transducer TonB [Acetobacteraceae bacterium]|nr:energy transducer TonB [Acetobacteraceae bacterium]